MTSDHIQFEFVEDREFFTKLLCDSSISLETYKNLFDFRLPSIKRIEFNKRRRLMFSELSKIYGTGCFLNYPILCDISSGLAVDHLIPLSTNQLNKALRHLTSAKGKKVVTQSFGSNHIDNLVIACSNCNNHKKHRILDREILLAILNLKKEKSG